MNNYIFNESQKFAELCRALPAKSRPTEAQIEDWNQKANKEALALYSNSSEARSYYAWIGINPPVGQYTLRELWAVHMLPYTDYVITIEQNTDGGIRPHLHALAKVCKNTRPNKEIERLSKLFQIASSSIEFKIHGNNLLSPHLKYLRGEKTSEKLENVNKDIKDKEDANIPKFLSIGIV